MRLPVLAALWVLASATLPGIARGGSELQPRRGGIVFVSGNFDLEVVLTKPKGRYQVFFTDSNGEDLPASVVSDVAISYASPAHPERA